MREQRAWARVELGMHAEEFGRLNLAELFALIEVWTKREQRQDLRAARICRVMANMHRGKNTAPFDDWDFFESLESMRPEPPTDEELEKKIEAVFDRF
jgi:hypothetical protein